MMAAHTVDIEDQLITFTRAGDGCWDWVGPKSNGRGIVGGRVHELAYRAMYVLIAGAIPSNRSLHHLCRNPACVRPTHLQLVTRSEHQAISNRETIARNPNGRNGGCQRNPKSGRYEKSIGGKDGS